MDSGRGGRVPGSVSSSSSIQDSSIFNDITNLSPIRPCNESSSHLPPLDYVFGSPRHNSQRATSFTQRVQKPRSSDAEPSLEENARPKISPATEGVSQPPISQLTVQPIPCTQEHDGKVSEKVQLCCPSGGINEILANPLKEFVRFAESPKTIDPSQDLQNDLKENIAEVLVVDNIQKGVENQLAPTVTLPDKVGDNPKGKKSLIRGNSTVKGGVSLDGQADKGVNYPGSEKQQEHHLVDQAATVVAPSMANTQPGILEHKEHASFSSSGFHQLGIEDNFQAKQSTQQENSDYNPELLPKTSDSSQLHGINNENKRTTNKRTIGYKMHKEYQEPDQRQRGIQRHCLEAEGADAGRKSINSHSSSWNPTNAVHGAVPSAPSVHSNTSNALSSNLLSRNKRLANFEHQFNTSSRLSKNPFRMLESHIDKIDISARNSRNPMITGSIPTSIGFHMNRIGDVSAPNSGLNVQLAGKDYLGLPGEKTPSGRSHHLSEDSMGHLAPVNDSFGNSVDKLTAKPESSLAYSVHINIEVGQDENQASMTANSPNTSQTVNKLKPWDNSQQLNPTDQYEVLCESRRTATQDVYAFEEFKQTSPRKKRKEETSVEMESCKRCNCKKSKCLKLYCDCFAAGVYCVDSCSCQECFNKTEYEDTVLETRQQIESRNPLAFAPKIVRRVIDSPQSSRENGIWTTPTSARHKRGCNCKKSMCLKKYCECYQAGVGCSDGCRCEGCKNVFGKKEGSTEVMEVDHRKVVDTGPMVNHSDGKMLVPDNTQGYTSQPGQYIPDTSLLAPLYQGSNQDRILPRFQHPAGICPTSSPQHDHSFLSQPQLHYLQPEKADLFSHKLKEYTDVQSFIALEQLPQSVTGVSTSPSITYLSETPQAPIFHPNLLSFSSSLHWPTSTSYPNHPHSLGPSLHSGLYNILEGEYPHKLKPVNTSSADEKSGSPLGNCLEDMSRPVSLADSIPKALLFPETQTNKIHEGSDKESEGSKTE